MDLPQYITAEFDRQCKAKWGHKPDLYQFFSNHERRPLLEQNLAREIRELETVSKIILTKEKIEMIVIDFCKQFFTIALMAAEKAALSEAERQRQLHEEHEFNEIQKMLEDSVVRDDVYEHKETK